MKVLAAIWWKSPTVFRLKIKVDVISTDKILVSNVELFDSAKGFGGKNFLFWIFSSCSNRTSRNSCQPAFPQVLLFKMIAGATWPEALLFPRLLGPGSWAVTIRIQGEML